VIVVVGQPVLRRTDAGSEVAGLPAQIAVEAAAHGRSVQLVGSSGEDEAGDAILLALARSSVGHVAMLRKAGTRTPTVSDAGLRSDSSVEGQSPLGEVGADLPPTGAAAQSSGAATALDAGDVDLALRYLTDFGVLVLAGNPGSDVARVVADAASWSDARLVVLVLGGESEPAGLPPDAIVFAAPDADPDGAFAAMVGSFAAALDDGDDPATAFRSTVAAGGWTASGDDSGS